MKTEMWEVRLSLTESMTFLTVLESAYLIFKVVSCQIMFISVRNSADSIEFGLLPNGLQEVKFTLVRREYENEMHQM